MNTNIVVSGMRPTGLMHLGHYHGALKNWIDLQKRHVEMMREIARRFNHLYGKEKGYEDKALEAVKLLGSDAARRFKQVRKYYQETGQLDALAEGHRLIAESTKLTVDDKARLAGYLEGTGKTILTEPSVSLTKDSKLPGLDGAKMSKSYNNTIALRELPKDIESKILRMPTDPARQLRTDVGNPELCPVWKFHQVYSDAPTQAWAKEGCTTAAIGCVDCKRPVITAVQTELAPMRERALALAANPARVQEIIAAGCAVARKAAQATMHDVRTAMGLLV